ncbi:MAB_1171c family putative transporter [Micromonospora sp. NPDC050686]|uniref:MAB_1171c family putative transporter n=1 Tax=Micromonospora sp. NPDC050686 TaxID=3154631 RepID=UPI003400C15A
MSSSDAVRSQLVLLVLGWGVVGYRIWYSRRRPDDLAGRALSVAIAALAAGITIQFGAAAVDTIVGAPNVGRVASNCAVMVACGAGRVYLLHLWHPGATVAARARAEWARLVLLLAVIVVLFALAPPDPASSRGDPRHTATVYSSPYVYLYLGYLGYTLARMLRELRRCLPLVSDAVLRLTMRLGECGVWTGLAYVLFKAGYLVGHDFDVPVPGREVDTATPMYLLSIGLLTLCAAIPVGRATAGNLRRWSERYRSYQRLYPLWLACYRLAPTIALDPRTTRLRNWLTVRDLRFLLYRRVIEIRDGQLALRRRPPPAAGADSNEVIRLLTVLRNGAVDEPTPATSADGTELLAEVRRLERLAATYGDARRP